MGWFKPSVAVDDHSVRLKKAFSSETIFFEDIIGVWSERIGKITYDENFLILETLAGQLMPVGELDDGFEELNAVLAKKLCGFPKNWRVGAEDVPLGVRCRIWTVLSALSD